MLLLILGLIVWSAAHLLRSFAPDLRESMQQKFGSGAKGIVAGIILISLALMIIGYKNATDVSLWVAPAWMIYVNNALMVVALYVYFTTATASGTAFVFGSLKNPQLASFKVWAIAHLLVNGDLASVVLFGGLLVWAVVQVVVAGKADSLVDRDLAPIKSPWIHLVLVAVVFFVISIVHVWLGKWPFALA